MHEHPDRIPLEQCQDRRVYRVFSRNLTLGVFRATTRGFIGIRTKFGSRFLSEEYHWDTGAPHGTANPLEDLNLVLPDDIELRLELGTIDQLTKRPVDLDRTTKTWRFLDTNELATHQEIHAGVVSNKKLFDFLAEIPSSMEPR